MKTYYVAEFSYGTPSLTRIYVEKETDKSITINRSEKILGWRYTGKRILKSNHDIFTDAISALQYLIDRLQSYIEHQKQLIEVAEKQVYTLAELKTKLNEHN